MLIFCIHCLFYSILRYCKAKKLYYFLYSLPVSLCSLFCYHVSAKLTNYTDLHSLFCDHAPVKLINYIDFMYSLLVLLFFILCPCFCKADNLCWFSLFTACFTLFFILSFFFLNSLGVPVAKFASTTVYRQTLRTSHAFNSAAGQNGKIKLAWVPRQPSLKWLPGKMSWKVNIAAVILTTSPTECR